MAVTLAALATTLTATASVTAPASAAAATASAAPALASAAPEPSEPYAVTIVHTRGSTAALRGDLVRDDRVARVRRDLGLQARGNRAVSVRIPADDVTAQLLRLAALPGVTSVEPPVVRRLTASTPGFTPDDPYYARQAEYLRAVDAPAAWARQHGSAGVTIAVVDSGIDVTHPDLAGKIAGTYDAIDPAHHAITDTIGHGTFVAGVAAADTDNGVGVAGAGFDTRLLGVKVAGNDDSIAIDVEVSGIRWAADHGATIINLSLGGSGYSAAEAAAIAYAQRKGSLVVAAAGNDGTTATQYPAAYPGVVSVAAIDPATHARAPFSSYGPWVTLAAPGVGIVSTTPLRGSQFFAAGKYGSSDGTSFSAPIVSGEAALLKAQNPALTEAQLRAAVVASASGYRMQGLGAGVVDFAAGLDHVPPTSRPSALVPYGDHDEVAVHATSTAPAVAFRIDGGAYGRPVPVRSGSAIATLDTDGYPNGQHVLSAVDCTAYGECGANAQTATFPIDNDAPTITSPAPGAALTGLVTVTADRPDGGGVRLLVDGAARGFRAAAPYRFDISTSALVDGTHSVRAQLCSTDGTRCSGPASAALTVTSHALHPVLGALSPVHISPDGNHVDDTATLPFTLPQAQSAVVEVLDGTGAQVARADLGTLAAGRHSWTWNGLGSAGRRLPDGTYTLALATSQGALRGWVTADGVVDTSAPSITERFGDRTTFYPYPDGYHDTVNPRVVLGGAGTLTLTVTGSDGRVVRQLRAARGAGAAVIAWNGTDARHRRVPAGSYRIGYTITDEAGNSRSTPTGLVRVSGKRLQRETLTVNAAATASDGLGGSDTCARAGAKGSHFPGGVLLRNACPVDDYDIAYAQYELTVPHAIHYTGLAIGVNGVAGTTSAQLTASIQRTDGVLEVPAYVTVRPGPARWHTIATVSGAGHVTTARHVYFSVALTGKYAGTNRFDIATVRLRVGVVVLR